MDNFKKVIKKHNKVAWSTGETKQRHKLIKSKHGWLNVAMGITFASMGIIGGGIAVSADTIANTTPVSISQSANSNTSSNASQALTTGDAQVAKPAQSATNSTDAAKETTANSTQSKTDQSSSNNDSAQKVTPVSSTTDNNKSSVTETNKGAATDNKDATDKTNTSTTDASKTTNNDQGAKQGDKVTSNNATETPVATPTNQNNNSVPASTQATPPTPDLIHVQWGDTLTKYAEEYHTTVDAIDKLNGLRDENLIYAGDWIYVPGGRAWVTTNEEVKYNTYDRYLNGNDNSFLQLSANNALPDGLSITSNELGAPDNNNFSQNGTLSVKTTVNINSTDVTINPGDEITYNIANDTSMKNVIDWGKLTINSGSNDYGHWIINANDGVVNYVFDKKISLTTGSLDLIINVPFMKNDNIKQANADFSETFTQNNNEYNLKNFKYTYTYVDESVGYTRVQAPGTGSGLNYAMVSPYNGPTANGAVSYNGNHSLYDPSKGDEPSFSNVIYPTNAAPDPKLNTLTNRTYTTEIKGNGASFDMNSLMFGLPANLPYAVNWGGKYDGQWITLDKLQELIPGVTVTLDQINANDAKLIIAFPNGVPIQYLQYTGNFIAPDVNGTYNVNFGYHDDQNTDSNNSIDQIISYETSKNGFFPRIDAQNKKINANNFDKDSLRKYLLDGVSSNDVQDGTKDTVEIYNDTDLVNALNNNTPGVYNVTYKVSNSVGLTSYKTITVTVYLGENVTDTATGQKTIHYVDANGNTVAPDKVITVHYTRTGAKDPDTGKITWGSWTTTDNQNYDVESPHVDNMTPNQPDVKGKITEGENDATKVIYTDNTEQVTAQSTGTKTIHYVDANGKEVAPDKVITVHYTRTGTKNDRTDDVKWNAWTTSDDQNYDVKSPTVSKMIPDQIYVQGVIT